VVILADACADPERKGGGLAMANLALDEDNAVPVFRPRKEEMVEPLLSQIEERERLEREEHWRLLYVAMTRAEERLFVGGALSAADRNGPPAASWYRAIEQALTGLGGEWQDDPLWNKAIGYGDPPRPATAAQRAPKTAGALPDWIRAPAPIEARPPRPLAPSALGEDDVADPPPTPAMRAAAERGRLLHLLFERLPDVPEVERAERASAWLEHGAGLADAGLRDALVEDACRIIADPRLAALFGPGALAEAPIAALIGDGLVGHWTAQTLQARGARVCVPVRWRPGC